MTLPWVLQDILVQGQAAVGQGVQLYYHPAPLTPQRKVAVVPPSLPSPGPSAHTGLLNQEYHQTTMSQMGQGSASSVFSGRFLTLTIFPALTLLSAYLILGHLFEFETPLRSTYCSASTSLISPYDLPYTGIQRLDYELCFMVSVFHVALNDRIGYTFLKYFLGTSSIYVILPCLEALRPPTAVSTDGRLARSLRWPAIWLQAVQLVTLGVTMPLWGLVVSLVSASGSKATSGVRDDDQKHRKGVNQDILPPAEPPIHDVLSILPSVVFGSAIPSYALLHYQDPSITVLWQIFPIYVFLAGWIYRCFTKLARIPPAMSATNATRFILFTSFLTSSYFHLTTVWPLLLSCDTESLRQLFIPGHYSAPSSHVDSSVIAFLQYDFHFAWISAWFATFLTVRFRSIWHLARTVVVTSVGMVVVGPGAVVAGLVPWK
ncbi:hypothetical protein MD484_g6708, partial [Candolleomyces efflorescens]